MAYNEICILPIADVWDRGRHWLKLQETNFSLFPPDHQVSIMSHANALQHRGGLDFHALARGGERSYSTSFLVNLVPSF
jgi:hypothetical protein